MQTYETLFILDPDLEESELTKRIDVVQEIIIAGGGTILKVEQWGRRQLAYMIRKKREGYYVLIYFEAPPTLIAELNRRYKLLSDSILRSLVIQLRKGQIDEILRSDSSGALSGASEDEEKSAHKDEDNQDFEDDEELVASTEE